MKASKTGIIGNLYKGISQIETLARDKLGRVDYHPNGIILHDRKVIYFPIPKVACSSLKYVCAELLNIDTSLTPNRIHDIEFPTVTSSELLKFDDYWKFCFVRNPWDRVVSCFKEKIKEDENFTGNTNSFVNGVHKGLLEYGIFKAKMTFEEFAIAVASIPDSKSDPHFRSQHTFITNNKGKLLVDFIGKFERLSEDWPDLCDRLGVTNISLPHSNKTKHDSYRKYYTDNLSKIVAKRFSKDIAMFEYEF
jgi:hypothetical protein